MTERMKIDIHAHILPEQWPDLKERYGYGGFIRMDHYTHGRARMMYDDGRFFREVEENCWNPARILEDMDRHNVDVMTLSTVPVLFNYWAEPEHTHDWARFINDHLAEVQKDSTEVRADLDPLMSDLRDLRTALQGDLTMEGLKSLVRRGRAK